ncbi:MAG: CBS and ACT domain-containing protein [Pseudomonadota bacterium]
MLVKEWMSKDVITIDVEESYLAAAKSMKQNNIRILPVMKRGGLVGIITDRDLKRASASDATSLEAHELLYLLSELKASDIMTKHPITVPFDYTIEEAAQIMLEKKISGLPVMDHDNQVIGIITQSDIFRILVSMTGLAKRGVLFALRVEDRPGAIREAMDIIRSAGGTAASILTTYEKAPTGRRNVFFRMYGLDRQALPQLKKDLGEKATLRYWVDLLENTREIFEE